MKESILLIDDQPIINTITARNLQMMGVKDEIHSALSGRSALLLLEEFITRGQRLPRLMLIDINMPDLGGFDFVEAFQQMEIPDKDKITLAMLTSSISSKDKARAKELGVEHFLVKPFSDADVKKVLMKAGVLE